jgi:hypothetical protein
MLFCCKSLRFANFLISKGARLIRIDRDKLVRDRLVFIVSYWLISPHILKSQTSEKLIFLVIFIH